MKPTKVRNNQRYRASNQVISKHIAAPITKELRKKYPIRRLNGVRVSFEDNAAVIITPEGELKGTDIKGPVAVEASEKWPRIANLASMVV